MFYLFVIRWSLLNAISRNSTSPANGALTTRRRSESYIIGTESDFKMRFQCISLALVAMIVICLSTSGKTVSAEEQDHPVCACPRNFMPVCGSDNKTYSNRCLLHCNMESAQGRSVGLRMMHKGRCGN